ncbi:MAG: hypothetical protein ABSE49_22430 [Polyangiaceae bacterium]
MSHSPRVAALLRAGRAERAPAGNTERLLDGLGVGAAAAGGVSLAGTAVRAWLRWMGLGLLVAAVSVPLAWAIGARKARLEETDAAPVTAPERDAPLTLAPVTLAGRSLVERASPFAPPGPPHARVAPPPVLAAPSMEDELVHLREARRAIVHGDAATALTALEAQRREFPHGMLQEEAAALRVEALLVAGRSHEAERAADAFEAAYPSSPYATRIRRDRAVHRQVPSGAFSGAE